MATYDKRNSRPDAEALVRRRIDASRLRYRKADFGLGPDDKLADHAELVTIRAERMPNIGLTPYYLLLWGVKVNGKPGGYVSSSYHGDRFRFLPYWSERDTSVRAVPDAQDPPVPEPAPAAGPEFTYRQDGDRAWEIRVQESPGSARLGIGTVARSGSLPSMTQWNGRGNWPGARWTRSRQTRGEAAADVWREHQQRRAPAAPAG